jgi:hypothetical protein
VTIFTSQWTVRFLNTTLLHICCVETCPEVAIDRLGTHDLENFFGFLRWDADNINTPEQMIRTIAQTDIVKEANHDLGLDEPVHERVNLGGVHISDEEPSAKKSHLKLPLGLDAETIAACCLLVVDRHSGNMPEFPQIGFLRFVEYLKMLAIAARASRTNSETEQRFISGSGSRIITGFAAHRAPGCE